MLVWCAFAQNENSVKTPENYKPTYFERDVQ